MPRQKPLANHDGPMVEIKYNGAVGQTAMTPLGPKVAGELFEIPESQKPRWMRTGLFAEKGKKITKTTEAPTHDPVVSDPEAKTTKDKE